MRKAGRTTYDLDRVTSDCDRPALAGKLVIFHTRQSTRNFDFDDHGWPHRHFQLGQRFSAAAGPRRVALQCS